MSKIKFDKDGNILPQKIQYPIKHSKVVQEEIKEYIKNECNFLIEVNSKGDYIFIPKEPNKPHQINI